MLLGLQSLRGVWSRPVSAGTSLGFSSSICERGGVPRDPCTLKVWASRSSELCPQPTFPGYWRLGSRGLWGPPTPKPPGRVWPEGARASRHWVTTHKHMDVCPTASSQHPQPGGRHRRAAGQAGCGPPSASVLTEPQCPPQIARQRGAVCRDLPFRAIAEHSLREQGPLACRPGQPRPSPAPADTEETRLGKRRVEQVRATAASRGESRAAVRAPAESRGNGPGRDPRQRPARPQTSPRAPGHPHLQAPPCGPTTVRRGWKREVPPAGRTSTSLPDSGMM